MIPSTVFGPTCDSLDMIVKDYPMPLIEVGDWLYFPNMGAYTTAAMTRFNGFSGAITCHYCFGERFVENVLSELDFCLPARHPSFVPVPPSSSPEPSMMMMPMVPLADDGVVQPAVDPIGC